MSERRVDLGVLAAVVGVWTLAQVLTIGQYGIFRDELYYVACSRHLAWGYVDHPPLVAVLTWIGRALFGQSLPALRVIPIATGAAVMVVTAGITSRLGGDRFAQAVALISVAIAPQYLFVFHIASMNSTEVLLWATAMYVVVLAVDGGGAKPWLLFGALAGIGLLNKHSMLFLGLGILVGLLLSPARRQLATRWPWIAGALALALFAPHVLWQVRHGWPIVEFVRNAQENKIASLSLGQFLSAQVLLMHPLTVPIWFGGLAYFLWRRRGHPYQLFGWCFLTVMALLVFQRSKAYYFTPIYPMFLAGGAVLLEQLTGSARRVRSLVLAVMVAGGTLLAPMALPVLPVGAFMKYSRALGIKPSSGERHEMGALPQHFADMFGWEDLARTISQVYLSLPVDEQASARVFAQNYGEAGALEYFRGTYELPAVISPHNNYWFWGPGPDGGTLIVIDGDLEDHRKVFSNVQEVARTSCRYCMPYEQNRPILVGRGWRVSLNAIWLKQKDFN